MNDSPMGSWKAALTRCSTALVLTLCAAASIGWTHAAHAQSGTTFQEDLGLDSLLDSIFQGNDTVVLDEADLEAAVPYDQPEEAVTPDPGAQQSQPDASPAPAPAPTEVPELADAPALPKPRPAAPAHQRVGDRDAEAAEQSTSDGAEAPATGDDVAYADPAVAELILSVAGQEDAPAQADDGVASVRGSSGLTRLETSNSEAATFGTASESESGKGETTSRDAERQPTDSSALAFREDEWIPVPMDRPDSVPAAQAVSDIPVAADDVAEAVVNAISEATTAAPISTTAEAPAETTPSTRSAASSTGTGQARPAVDPQCPLRLERLGALFQSSPDFVEDSGCQNQGAVAVEAFGGGVSLSGRVVVACPVAEATALWLRNVVQTEALETFGTRVVGLSNVNGYSCRMRSGGYISEHGFANAIDIGTFHFEDGRRVNIEGGWRRNGTAMGDLTADWFARINEGACDYFQLVLNPNSDAAHQDHFHFDLGPWKSCD